MDQEGYPYLSGSWKQGDRIDTDSDMPVRAVAANPPVVQDAGKVAMTRESIVYCAEEMDNRANLHLLYLNGSALLDDENRVRVEPFTFQTGAVPDDPRAKGHVDAVSCSMVRLQVLVWWESADRADAAPLYRQRQPVRRRPIAATLIPYFVWTNCGENEMRVFPDVD